MDIQFLTLIAIGFVAQMVDGALGMAFGVRGNAGMLKARRTFLKEDTGWA
ncbi:hypothetical protein [Bradyrhizobium sp. AZCC 1721]